MRYEDENEDTLDLQTMSGGLKGLSERIEGTPKRAVLNGPPSAQTSRADFGRAASCLHDVEHGLDSLWPQD